MSGTAISTTSPRASSTVIASTAHTSRSAGSASIRNKLLIDPYAKQLAGRLVWSDAHFGYRAGSARGDLSFDRRDNARGMPKAVVIDEAFTWGEERRPAIPWEDTIIYEAHVKGLTQQREDVPPAWRGTLPRAYGAGRDRSSQAARRDRNRAAADPRLSSTTGI